MVLFGIDADLLGCLYNEVSVGKHFDNAVEPVPSSLVVPVRVARFANALSGLGLPSRELMLELAEDCRDDADLPSLVAFRRSETTIVIVSPTRRALRSLARSL